MRSLTRQWDSVRFIGLFGLLVYFSTVYFSMRSLNKPNKPVYLSMHSLTVQWDSVRFIGLFGLSVYFSMHSHTGEWDSVRFIGLFGLSVYFSTVYFSMGSLNKPNKPVYFSMCSLTRQWRNKPINQINQYPC